jgi:protein ImuB
MSSQHAQQLPLLSPNPASTARARLTSVAPPSAPVAQTRKQRGRAWLALHFPAWSMTAALHRIDAHTRALANSEPFAVVDDDRRRRVLACNAAAQRRSIRPGHSLNAAVALCAEATFATRNAEEEARLLEQTAAACQQYTSFVSLQPPNELLLEVRGSFRLFGGASALIERIRRDFEVQGIESNLALTATPNSALWLARISREPCVIRSRDLIGALSKLPISALHWPLEIELKLSRFGVRTAADLLRLPRAGLARRIGAERLAELDQATGKATVVRQSFREPEQYEDRVPLDFEIETTALLETLLCKRLDRLARFLQVRALAITALTIDLLHREHALTPIEVNLALPTADMEHVRKLLHERLAPVALPAPVLELHIHVSDLLPQAALSHSLFQTQGSYSTSSAQERAARLLEQLTSRLGASAILALRAAADHRPEHAQQSAVPELSSRAKRSARLPMLPKRPLWLLRTPKLLCNDHREAQHLAIGAGPESIQAGWWDGQFVNREYYIVHSRQGALCWVFRDLTQKCHWYLHGLFG